ncbi:MAG: NAD(P)-binding protein, partial [Myxococcaceae bacterium]|nr:NAD(P)-binding protein [Myxococcaceae bacterium]
MKRVAIIGGGISGLVYAHVLAKNGFQPVVFEQGPRVGGVWSLAYPGVRLQ